MCASQDDATGWRKGMNTQIVNYTRTHPRHLQQRFHVPEIVRSEEKISLKRISRNGTRKMIDIRSLSDKLLENCPLSGKLKT